MEIVKGKRLGSFVDALRSLLAGCWVVLCFSLPAFADWYPLGHTEDVPAFSDEHIQLLAPSDTGSRPALIYEGGGSFSWGW